VRGLFYWRIADFHFSVGAQLANERAACRGTQPPEVLEIEHLEWADDFLPSLAALYDSAVSERTQPIRN
jgi:hypothetical protein